MSDVKIKQSDVADIRASMLSEQSYRCALCGDGLDPANAALDHDHKSGRIRAVVHSDCNILLGKIENFIGRYGKRMDTEGRIHGFLRGAAEYMGLDYSHNPLHYKHKTPEDKLLLKYRRLKRRSKKPETKKKYDTLIKEITNAR